MTISIDGKKHKAGILVRHGDEFPRPYRSIEIDSPDYGECLIYVTAVGIPEWVDPLTVKVSMEYFITEITAPNAAYRKNRRLQKSGLKLVEG